LTAWPTVQGDLRQAGAHVVDRDVVVDDNWITSRKPADLEAFTVEVRRGRWASWNSGALAARARRRDIGVVPDRLTAGSGHHRRVRELTSRMGLRVG
jgi:hypothetical protein